jgi:transposase InsO family protein
MSRTGRGREEMEKKYGEVGSGATTIAVRGAPHRLRGILARWMMDVPEIMTLDGGTLGEDRYWIRFIDKDDRCYVAFEFNGEFDILSEMRVDSLAWEGEDFFASRWR